MQPSIRQAQKGEIRTCACVLELVGGGERQREDRYGNAAATTTTRRAARVRLFTTPSARFATILTTYIGRRDTICWMHEV